MKKYTILIRGHKTVFAKDEKQATKLVDESIEHIHQNFNLKTHKEL